MADEWSQYVVASTDNSSQKDEWAQYATSPQDTQGSSLSSIPSLPDIQTISKPTDPLNIGDHAALSFLTNPQDQKNYLQKKFPFVVPADDKGNFMVGQSADSLTPLNAQNSGNNFFSWLASQSSQIPSMIGMGVGAGLGTVEPGGGNVVGAAAGAAGGEAVSKMIGHAIGSTDSLEKDAVDTAISGAFGAVGQKAAQMFGVASSKFIAPKLAQAVDGKLTQIVNNGDDPSKFINFVSAAVHFASGADAEDVKTLMQYGVNKSLNDAAVNNKNAIINIAGDILNATQAKKTALGTAVGVSNKQLLDTAGKININTNPIFDYIKQEISAHPGWGTMEDSILTLNRNAANSADSTQFGHLLRSLGAEDIRTTYQAPKTSQLFRQITDTAKKLQLDFNNPSDHPLLEKSLGLNSGDVSKELERIASAKQEFSMGGARAFKIPEDGKINVKQAVGTQNIFGQLTDKEKTPLSDDMRRVFTNVLYRDASGNDSPLALQLSGVAKSNGIDSYIANKLAYKNFMKSIENVQSNGFDPFNPKSIQDYGRHINDRLPIDAQTLKDFENNIGTPILDNLKRYSAIQKLSNFNPNFLRLGLISGMVGSMLGDGNFEQRIGRGAAFGLGIPLGLKTSLRTIESTSTFGKNVLSKLIKVAPAVASQSGAHILQKLTGNSNNKQNSKK